MSRPDGVKLLFDAGISGIQVKERLALHGRDVEAVDAVLISHDHVDHSRSMGILHRKFGLPIYATAKTYRGGQPLLHWAKSETCGTFAAGETRAIRQGDGGNDLHARTTPKTAWCSWWMTASTAWAS